MKKTIIIFITLSIVLVLNIHSIIELNFLYPKFELKYCIFVLSYFVILSTLTILSFYFSKPLKNNSLRVTSIISAVQFFVLQLTLFLIFISTQASFILTILPILISLILLATIFLTKKINMPKLNNRILNLSIIVYLICSVFVISVPFETYKSQTYDVKNYMKFDEDIRIEDLVNIFPAKNDITTASNNNDKIFYEYTLHQTKILDTNAEYEICLKHIFNDIDEFEKELIRISNIEFQETLSIGNSMLYIISIEKSEFDVEMYTYRYILIEKAEKTIKYVANRNRLFD